MDRGAGDKLGDKALLDATKQDHRGNETQLSYVLPSGQVMRSEWMPNSELTAGVLINWCNAVKQAVSDEAAEQQAQARRQEAEDTPQKMPQKAPQAASMDPDEFIKLQLLRADREAREATQALIEAEQLVVQTGQALKKWSAVAEGLGITLGKDENESNETGSTSDTEGSDSDGDGISPHPVRTGGTDADRAG